MHSALAQIESAFDDAPRPSDGELLHERCRAAAVDSTIWSLAPVFYEDAAIQDFTVSKFASLTEDQRAAVVAFLEAVIQLGDDYVTEQAGKALSWWRAP